MLLGTAVAMTLYIILIRPFLMLNMRTVTFELIIAGITVFALITSLLIFIGTLLITLIMGIFKNSQSRIRPWIVKLRKRFVITIVLGLVFIGITLISQWLAYTPPILGEDGKELKGSIATLEKVILGDSKQWITIRGNNVNNPILLFLAGGPGGSQLAATRSHLKELEKHFVVVNWDQPGAGKSYNSVSRKKLTPKRYISDAHELTMYLRNRFNQEKIYVLGESWGSALGILIAQRYPELYHAFIGTGQMVSFRDTEIMDYKQALKIAKDKGDKNKIKQLELQGVPPYYGKDVVWKEAAYLMYLSNYMANNPNIKGPGYNTLGDIAAPEYGIYDKLNFVRGPIKTFNHVYQQLYDFDFRKQVTKIDVPVFILHGRHDINAPTILVEEYFEILDAPMKELIWFENSGHSPWIDEEDRFIDMMVYLLNLR